VHVEIHIFISVQFGSGRAVVREQTQDNESGCSRTTCAQIHIYGYMQSIDHWRTAVAGVVWGVVWGRNANLMYKHTTHRHYIALASINMQQNPAHDPTAPCPPLWGGDSWHTNTGAAWHMSHSPSMKENGEWTAVHPSQARSFIHVNTSQTYTTRCSHGGCLGIAVETGGLTHCWRAWFKYEFVNVIVRSWTYVHEQLSCILFVSGGFFTQNL